MSAPNTCPRCGAKLAPHEDPAKCPRCLLRVGIDVSSVSSGGARVPAPTIAELQPYFPELELLALVGEGGMGAVYKARDKKLEREIALKILTVRDEEPSAQFDERFAREARAMASLSHPNIAAVHSFGRSGPWSWLAMEFVEGENLRRVLRSRAVSPREALAWVVQMCDALQYAHEHGVVHRDIKPENVLVDAQGRVKLVDFGLAKLLFRKPGEATLTGTQQSLGTWHYMAPEQYERPQTVDHRADIYSLGVVFYELLTGQVPVGRFDLPSQRIQLDVRIDDVVLKALAREPEKRFQAASEVKSEVSGIASGSPAPAPAAARGSGSAGKWIAVVAAAVFAMLGLGALALVAFVLLAPAGGRSNTLVSALAYAPWVAVLAGFGVLGVLGVLAWRRRHGPASASGARRFRSNSILVVLGAGALLAVLLAALVTLVVVSPERGTLESGPMSGDFAVGARLFLPLVVAIVFAAVGFVVALVWHLAKGRREDQGASDAAGRAPTKDFAGVVVGVRAEGERGFMHRFDLLGPARAHPVVAAVVIGLGLLTVLGCLGIGALLLYVTPRRVDSSSMPNPSYVAPGESKPVTPDAQGEFGAPPPVDPKDTNTTYGHGKW